MPYADFSYGRGAIMEGMMTPTVMKIAVLMATVTAVDVLGTHPHVARAMTPGHFDSICPKCVEIAGFDLEEVEHLNEWPAEQKEAFRQALADAMYDKRPTLLRWRLRRGWRRQRTDIKVQPRSTIVTFHQAAAASGEAREWLEAVRAAKRAKREAVAGR